MPARKHKIRHDENTRAKIKAAAIIERLRCFVLGTPDRSRTVPKLSPAQVTAALGLLRKSLPDLDSVEVTGDITNTYVVESPKVSISTEEWAKSSIPATMQ